MFTRGERERACGASEEVHEETENCSFHLQAREIKTGGREREVLECVIV